jgi:hypothetical protein
MIEVFFKSSESFANFSPHFCPGITSKRSITINLLLNLFVRSGLQNLLKLFQNFSCFENQNARYPVRFCTGPAADAEGGP